MSSQKGGSDQRTDGVDLLTPPVVAATSGSPEAQNDDHSAPVRAIFDAVEESPEIAARRGAILDLAGMYLRGEMPDRDRSRDLRVAATLYSEAGATKDLLGIADLMAEDIGRLFSASEVAQFYLAAGPDGAAKLAQLIDTYLELADRGRIDYTRVLDFLAVTGDAARLVQLGDKLLPLSSSVLGDPYWNYAIRAYRLARADDKLAAMGDIALQNRSAKAAFAAYKDVSTPLPESSVDLLVALAEQSGSRTLPDPATAIAALKLAGTRAQLVDLGDRLAATMNLNPSFAVDAYTAAGALGKLVAYSKELAASYAESGRSSEYTASRKALESATALALEKA